MNDLSADSSASPVPPAPVEASLISRSLARKLLVATAVGVFSYGALLFYADAGAFGANLAKLTPGVIVAATAWSIANFVLRAIRWEYYLRRIGLRVPLGESLLIFVGGFAMSITPAKSGEVLKSLMLKASCNASVARTAPIVIAERLTDVASLVLLAGLGLAATMGQPLGFLLALAAVLALGAVTGSRRLGALVIDACTRFRRTARLRVKLHEAHGSLLSLVTPGPFAIGTLLSAAAWATHGIALYVIVRSFPGATLSLAGSMLAYSSPLLAGTLAMIPGGLGLTEASMTGVLVKIGGPGVSLAVATTVSLVVRVLTFWLAIALGFVALAVWQLRRRNLSAALGASSITSRP